MEKLEKQHWLRALPAVSAERLPSLSVKRGMR